MDITLIRSIVGQILFSDLGDLFSGMGAGVLGYRGYLAYKGEISLDMREVAAQASARTPFRRDAYVEMFGISEVFDFDEARSLGRRRIEAWVGMTLIILGGLLPLVGLAIRRGPAIPGVIAVGFLAGIICAGVLMQASRCIWRRVKEEKWLAYTWLASLERQVPNPLAGSMSPSQSLTNVGLVSPHPDLYKTLRHGEPMTGEEHDRIVQWIADFAIKWDYPASELWREWLSRTRTEARGAR